MRISLRTQPPAENRIRIVEGLFKRVVRNFFGAGRANRPPSPEASSSIPKLSARSPMLWTVRPKKCF